MIIRGNKKPKGTKTKESKGFSRRNKSKKTHKTHKPSQRKKKIQVKIMPDKQLGGFLPFPPKDCKKKEFITWAFGVQWIDLNICHGCPIIKECSARKEHLHKLKEQRKIHFEGKEK
jgi:hypothetical protein